MKKRRGTTRTATAAAIIIGGGAAVASILCAIVSTTSTPSHLIPVVVEAASSTAAIRGGGGGGGDNNGAARRHLLSNKRHGDDSRNKRRPAILDSHQDEKIERWKEDRQQQQQSSVSSSRQRKMKSSSNNIQNKKHDETKEALFFHESSSVLPQLTPSGKRRLYDYMTLNHKKQSDYGSVSVSKVDGDELHFQTVPPTTTTTSTTTTTTTSTTPSIVAANSEGSMETYHDHASSSNNNFPEHDHHLYFPIITPDQSVGTCTNNGNEPDHYTSSNGFLYYTLEECCQEWFVDAEQCMVGFAVSSGGDGDGSELLLRDPSTGMILSESSSSSSSSSSSGTTSTTSSSSSLFYPSFDMTAYPDGACLNDGKQPEIYTTQPGYLFDSISVCCHDWFIDELGCEEASFQVVASYSSGGGGGGGEEPVPSPASDTDWPTWPIEFDYDDEDEEEVVVDAPQEASSTTSMTAQEEEEEESLSFYESFESGDFNRNDWRLTSSSPTSDLWEADQSAWAYDGHYAARPGVLSEPNSQSNLTISLEDVHAIRHGGYLTFAIHASVSYPVDVLLFAINDNVIRTFDEVTGDEGTWEEVSVLLHAGEHQLTWSYQYFGMISETSTLEVDPRRVGNSWVDAIKLRPFTGDVTIADDDDGTTLALTNGMAPFELLPDVDAYAGSKSYVAYTGAIDASQGSAEMSWEVYIGPSGGVLSFAVFASLYAPHDVCEFSIDGLPQVVIATPSDEWEVHHVAVDPGKHELKWKLIKNVSGLNTATINDVDVPSDYQGYVKVDGISLEDNSVTHDVHEEVPVVVTDKDEEVLVAVAEEVADSTTTTTTVSPTSTAESVTTTTSSTTEATTTEEPTTTSTTEDASTTTTTTTEFVECPSNLFAVEGLPGCCVEEPSYLGDGACDPRAPYNTEACAFDLGDCCHETCNPDSAYGCITKEGGEYGPFGFFCIDPRFGNMDAQKCQVENLEWIGDGGCDNEGGYNTPECGWDGGDCCEETCDPEHSFYPCGANQPYTCMDPSVSNEKNETTTSDSPEKNETTTTSDSPEKNETTTTTSDSPEKNETTTKSDSPFEFHDGFESGVFDPLHWDVDDGDAEWKVEDSEAAVEGSYYIAARTGDISPQYGTAKLKHGIESLGGGVLSFDIQALVQIPFDDVIIMIDDDIVAEFSRATEGWERHELDIPVGPHMVQWIHRKNPSNMLDSGLTLFGDPDEGVTMIDNVAFQPS